MEEENNGKHIDTYFLVCNMKKCIEKPKKDGTNIRKIMERSNELC